MKPQILKLLNNFLETRKRKRRWGDENDKVQLGAPILLPTPGVLPSGPLKNVGNCVKILFKGIFLYHKQCNMLRL